MSPGARTSLKHRSASGCILKDSMNPMLRLRFSPGKDLLDWNQPEQKMKTLIIIATYNAMRWAERCFKSVRSSSIKPDVFVVDNGSTDGTQAYIQEHFPEFIFQQSSENLGFGKANNIGLQYALDNNYDYVYLLNQDAWIFSDTIERLIEISRQHPEYGIISPFQMCADMYHIDAAFIGYIYSNNDMLNDMYKDNLSDLYPVDLVMAAHWLVPCSVLKTVGGFSPSFQHYGEDDNFVHRAKWRKYKIGIAPRIVVVHDHGEREDSMKTKLFFRYTYNIALLSNPNISILHSSWGVVRNTYRNARIYKSTKPFCDLMRIIGHYGEIIKNRRISMKEQRAFLI